MLKTVKPSNNVLVIFMPAAKISLGPRFLDPPPAIDAWFAASAKLSMMARTKSAVLIISQ